MYKFPRSRVPQPVKPVCQNLPDTLQQAQGISQPTDAVDTLLKKLISMLNLLKHASLLEPAHFNHVQCAGFLLVWATHGIFGVTLNDNQYSYLQGERLKIIQFER
jgi:hypothetical protein